MTEEKKAPREEKTEIDKSEQGKEIKERSHTQEHEAKKTDAFGIVFVRDSTFLITNCFAFK